MSDLTWEQMEQILYNKQLTVKSKHKEHLPVTIKQIPIKRKRTPQMWKSYKK